MVFAAVVPAKSCVEWNYWRILFFCSSVWFFNLHFYVSSWRVFYTHAYAGIFHCNENKDFSFVLLSAKSSEAIFLRLSSVGHFLRWNNWATALFVKKKKKSFHCRRTWEDQARYFGKKKPLRMVVVAMPPTIPKRRRIFTHFLGVRRPFPTLWTLDQSNISTK